MSTPVHSDLPLAARRHPAVGEIARRLSGRCGVPCGARLVIGLSGGADSTALLIAAAVLRRRRRPWVDGVADPLAVHVNHHLRPGADADEALAVEAAGSLGVPVEVRHVRPAVSSGVPAEARRLRHEALAAAARDAGAAHVAVAHTAGDQIETMLMALARGAGIDGAAGMPWTRVLQDTVHLVRPMLGLCRHDAEDLCRAAGRPWCTDPTNADPCSPRVRLRSEVIPVLEALWPGATRRAAHTAEVLAAGAEAMHRQVAEVFGPPDQRCWSRSALRSAGEVLVAAGLRRAVIAARPDCADEIGSSLLVPAAEAIVDGDTNPREFQAPGRVGIVVTADTVEVEC